MAEREGGAILLGIVEQHHHLRVEHVAVTGQNAGPVRVEFSDLWAPLHWIRAFVKEIRFPTLPGGGNFADVPLVVPFFLSPALLY